MYLEINETNQAMEVPDLYILSFMWIHQCAVILHRPRQLATHLDLGFCSRFLSAKRECLLMLGILARVWSRPALYKKCNKITSVMN